MNLAAFPFAAFSLGESPQALSQRRHSASYLNSLLKLLQMASERAGAPLHQVANAIRRVECRGQSIPQDGGRRRWCRRRLREGACENTLSPEADTLPLSGELGATCAVKTFMGRLVAWKIWLSNATSAQSRKTRFCNLHPSQPKAPRVLGRRRTSSFSQQ